MGGARLREGWWSRESGRPRTTQGPECKEIARKAEVAPSMKARGCRRTHVHSQWIKQNTKRPALPAPLTTPSPLPSAQAAPTYWPVLESLKIPTRGFLSCTSFPGPMPCFSPSAGQSYRQPHHDAPTGTIRHLSHARVTDALVHSLWVLALGGRV